MYGLIFQGSRKRTSRRITAGGCRGFTLVELLVVVAIIALLVSILLPSLGKAKEQARMVMCLSNMRGLSLAFTFYTDENNDWYPAGASSGMDWDGADLAGNWDTILQPYYESYGLLECPSDKEPRPWVFYWGNDQYGPPQYPRYPRSYGINVSVSWMGPSPADPDFWPGWVHKTTDVTDPNETILLGEIWWSQYWGSAPMPGQYGAYQGCGIYTNRSGRFATTDVHRNNDIANYLFCDGHVAPVPADEERLNGPDYYYWYRVK